MWLSMSYDVSVPTERNVGVAWERNKAVKIATPQVNDTTG